MAASDKRKFNVAVKPNSAVYSDNTGSIKNWTDFLDTTYMGNTFNGVNQLTKTDSTGKLPYSVIPQAAITEIFVASSQAEMLALDAEAGDFCVRTDENDLYVLSADPASTLSNWIKLSITIEVFHGATAGANGQQGMVPAPVAGQQNFILYGGGNWRNPELTLMNIDVTNISNTGKNNIADIVKSIVAMGSEATPTGSYTELYFKTVSNLGTYQSN